jgi:hypothetical protein
MRAIAMAAGLVVAGCSGISSVPHDSNAVGQAATAGMPYALPKGVVPVQVFVDSSGIGLTIEPAQTIADPETGILVARLKPSIFNDEKMKLAADPTTGFLSTVSSDSEAKLLAIVEEVGKTAGRLSLQSAKAAFFEGKVVVLEDSFDPLSQADIGRVNAGINSAIGRAAGAFNLAGGRLGRQAAPLVTLRVEHAASFPRAGLQPSLGEEPPHLGNCAVGVCVRAMVSRVIRVELDGQAFASKVVNVPSREVVAVPVPQTILANQKVTMTIKDGILTNYDMDRDSELLGLVKIPGALIGGVIAGMTQGLGDAKTMVDKRKDLADSETALAEAEKKKVEATKLKLQSGNASGAKPTNAYMANALTVYPYSATLVDQIRKNVLSPKAEPATPGPKPGDGGLLN